MAMVVNLGVWDDVFPFTRSRVEAISWQTINGLKVSSLSSLLIL